MKALSRTRMALGLGIAAAMLLSTSPAAGQATPSGQEKKMVLEEQDTMSNVLKRLEGKPVRIRLAGSGEEVIGRLQKVGKELVHLSDLSGREFFDAVVRIDQISAVSAQVRGH